jgi:hypothetical protein
VASTHGTKGTCATVLLNRVVSPVHQRVAPIGVLYVTFGLLSLMTVDVRHHLFHVRDVIVGIVGLFLVEQLENAPAEACPGDSLPSRFCPTRLESSVSSQPSSSLGVMLTASLNTLMVSLGSSAISWLSLARQACEQLAYRSCRSRQGTGDHPQKQRRDAPRCR